MATDKRLRLNRSDCSRNLKTDLSRTWLAQFHYGPLGGVIDRQKAAIYLILAPVFLTAGQLRGEEELHPIREGAPTGYKTAGEMDGTYRQKTISRDGFVCINPIRGLAQYRSTDYVYFTTYSL